MNGKRGAVGMSGYAGLADMAEGVKAVENTPAGKKEGLTWKIQLENWHEELEQLAGQFASGHASVDPHGKACMYCDLKTFWRINERRRNEAEADTDG